MNQKQKAFVGDALILLYARLIFNTKHQNAIVKICSNEYLARVVDSMGIKIDGGDKAKGTFYEAKVFDIYDTQGIQASFDYWRTTVYEYYLDH